MYFNNVAPCPFPCRGCYKNILRSDHFCLLELHVEWNCSVLGGRGLVCPIWATKKKNDCLKTSLDKMLVILFWLDELLKVAQQRYSNSTVTVKSSKPS